MKNRSEEVLKRAFNSQQQGSAVVHQSRSEVPRQNSPTNGSLKATYLSTVLRMYFVEGLGYHTIGKLIPVSVSSIAGWIRNFAKQHHSKSEIMESIIRLEENNKESGKSPSSLECTAEVTGNNSAKINPPDDYATEIHRLKEELKFQRLRADAYDEMITVAEQRFKVNIRKKAGAKQ